MRPYVGWRVQESSGAPFGVGITFNFASVVELAKVDIHGLMGNSYVGNATEPDIPDYFRISSASGSVEIDRSSVAPDTRTYVETIDAGGLRGDSFTLSMGFNYDTSDFLSERDFIFISEVMFTGPDVATVPLPAGGFLLLGGLGTFAVASRRSARSRKA